MYYLNEDGTVDSDDLLIVINGWGICDAGESSAMGGGGSGEQDIWETLQQLPGLPPEVLEMIQEALVLQCVMMETAIMPFKGVLAATILILLYNVMIVALATQALG